jgi:hypothetical protein
MPGYYIRKDKRAMDSVDEALSLLNEAFGPPVYLGELSRPQPNSTQFRDLLKRAIYVLRKGQASQGGNAISHYYLGVLYRYVEGGVQDSRNHFKLALHYDPDFLEAEIALRDEEQYLDPFYYPKWEDLRDGNVGFRPSVLQACHPKGCRVDLVRCNSLIVPAVIIRYPTTSFRAPLTEGTAARILVNVEAVPPNMSALGHIVPIIFDDLDNPFFCSSYLNLFPVETELSGIPVLHPSDYQPLLGRDTVRRFCQEPGRCALYVLNTDNQMMMARLIEFDELEREHLRETEGVLKVLGIQKSENYVVWKSAVAVHDRVFVREIVNPEGRIVRIPKGRDIKQAQKYIIPILARNGRLEARGMEQASDRTQYRRYNDVFISHAHADAIWVSKISNWLMSIWPSLRLFRTDPEDQDRYKRDPNYFIMEMVRSKCIIFLATPRSIDRPMVGLEIGAAARKQLITLLAGGSTKEDLRRRLEEDLFSRINLERVASADEESGWEQFAHLVAEELRITLPVRIPEGPVLRAEDIIKRGPTDPRSKFIDDYLEIMKRSDFQTESKAESLLEALEEEIVKRAEERGVKIRLDMLPEIGRSLRGRLINILVGESNESLVSRILDHFPALVDEDLIGELNIRIDYLHDDDEDYRPQIKRLLEIVKKKLRS